MRRTLALVVLLVATSGPSETVRGDIPSSTHERVTCSIATGATDVAAAKCYRYELAPWRPRKHLERDPGEVWSRAANHHSRSRAQNSKTRQRTPKRQTANADQLLSDIDDDRADLALLVTLLGDDDDLQRVMSRPSGSVGPVHTGSLDAAVQLPPHDGYVVRDPSRAWGTADTIARLTSAFEAFMRADPFAPRIRVHDLSLQSGGPMCGHKSHQSGRDVDLAYYRRTCDRECAARPVSASELDAGRQWRLLRHWLERGQAEFIFVDYALQRPLYAQAKSAGATPRQLAQWFQYPRGPAFPTGVIRHVANHANHVHIRFRCAPRDRACSATAARRAVVRGKTAALSLLELLDDDSEVGMLLEQLEH